MRRILLLAATLTVALPAAASEAAVIPSVSGGTLTVTGDAAADQITLRLTSPTTLDVNGVPFQRGTFSKVAVRSGAGDDTIRIADPLTEPVTIESGAGADAVTGSAGAESIATGDDADLVHPGGGDDSVALGNGDDTVIQGDGFDQLDGQLGKDTLQAIGSDESEEFTVQANGAKLRVSRDTGPATSDAAGVEALDVVASSGQDLVDVGDLAPTELLNLDADLGASDGARDQIAVQGTDGFDIVNARASLDDVRVEGLDATIRIRNAAVGDDRLTLFGRDGIDFLAAEGSAAARIAMTLDGGAGVDVLDGSDRADTLLGGPGDDVVSGGRGNDTVDLGDGADRFNRTRADGIDHVEGGAGEDRVMASGTEADDFIDVLGLLTTTRVLYGFEGSAELRAIEQVDVAPFGGTDNVKVGDLTGTATKTVNVSSNTADLRVDTITATGSPAAETIRASTSGTTHTITGLAATVNVTNPEQGEKIAIDARDGADTIDATGVTKDKLQPILKGGAGNDTIVGTTGQDLVSGGTGTDVVLLGAGLDTVTWNPGEGNDIIEGGSGTDFLQMTGSGGNDRFDVTPVGSRTRVTRDIENVNLDMGGLERLDIVPGPGGDIVRVADMSGTSTDHVDVGLQFARGTTSGDNLIDRVFVDGTFGNDVIDVNGAGTDVRTTGTAAIVTTRGTDPELDRLHVDTKPGNDQFTITGTAQQLIGVTHS